MHYFSIKQRVVIFGPQARSEGLLKKYNIFVVSVSLPPTVVALVHPFRVARARMRSMRLQTAHLDLEEGLSFALEGTWRRGGAFTKAEARAKKGTKSGCCFRLFFLSSSSTSSLSFFLFKTQPLSLSFAALCPRRSCSSASLATLWKLSRQEEKASRITKKNAQR